MKESTTLHFKQYLPWILSSIVSLIALYVWGHSFAWSLSAINAYQFFPLLGLLGFSIMWSHYVIGSLRQNFLRHIELRPYFRYTDYAVLLAIVLHPGILIYQRFRDGYGLPPHSYETYVAPGMDWITLLGSVSLLAFLAFEFHRLFAEKRWWKYVVGAGDLAMLAIFYHGLRLGSQLQGGWFRMVWWFYGLSLLALLVRKYVLLARGKAANATTTW
jgi:hypothetical protein